MQHLNFNTMKNWMSKISDDRIISSVTIPGTHDSSCRYIDFAFISKTQNLTVAQQLDIGVRYFDFRFKFDGNKFVANHSIASCHKKFGFWSEHLMADDIVSCCKKFLRENPSETILFQLKEAASCTGDSFFAAFYEKYIKDFKNEWYLENRIPSMGEIRGKIVLLRVVGADPDVFNDSNSGINFSSYPYVGSTFVDDWRTSEIKSLDTDDIISYMFVQDSYKVEGRKKWSTIKNFLDSQMNNSYFNICLMSCTRFCVPMFNSKYINSKFLQTEFKDDKIYGIIVADYITEEISSKIIKLNGI